MTDPCRTDRRLYELVAQLASTLNSHRPPAHLLHPPHLIATSEQLQQQGDMVAHLTPHLTQTPCSPPAPLLHPPHLKAMSEQLHQQGNVVAAKHSARPTIPDPCEHSTAPPSMSSLSPPDSCVQAAASVGRCGSCRAHPHFPLFPLPANTALPPRPRPSSPHLIAAFEQLRQQGGIAAHLTPHLTQASAPPSSHPHT